MASTELPYAQYLAILRSSIRTLEGFLCRRAYSSRYFSLRSAMQNDVLPLMGELAVEEITRKDVDQFKLAVKDGKHIAWLFFACGYMVPTVQCDWLREVKTRQETNSPKRPHKAMPFDSVTLQDLGLKMMDEADASLINLGHTDQRQIRVIVELCRDGLIIALLALTGLRRRNL